MHAFVYNIIVYKRVKIGSLRITYNISKYFALNIDLSNSSASDPYRLVRDECV